MAQIDEDSQSALPAGSNISTKEAALQSIGGKRLRRKVLYVERDASPKSKNPTPGDKKPDKYVVVESPAVVDGSELLMYAVQGRAGGSDYQIAFSFKKTGADKFGEWTGKNIATTWPSF